MAPDGAGLQGFDLTALVASRLCHDLISPIGAIGNGIELLQATTPASDELSLIGQSADTARAKLTFFRIAFGAASTTETLPAATLRSTAEGMLNGGRLKLTYDTGNLARAEAKLMFLLLLCCESALPFGGTLTASKTGDMLEIDAWSDRIKLPQQAWDHMLQGLALPDIIPAQVHFLLARQTAAQSDLTLGGHVDANSLRLFAS